MVVIGCGWHDRRQWHWSHHYLCPVYLTELPPERASSVVDLWPSYCLLSYC